MIVIKLNPSQELRLRKSVQCNAEFANTKGFEGGSIFATPLLCPIANISREEFLSIKKISIYKMQNAGGVYFFPCLLEMSQRTERATFLCGISVQQPQGINRFAVGSARKLLNRRSRDWRVEGGDTKFSLQGFLNKAGGIIAATPQAFWAEENFFFNATSFKMCRMEINGNSWKVYDEVWKKV